MDSGPALVMARRDVRSMRFVVRRCILGVLIDGIVDRLGDVVRE